MARRTSKSAGLPEGLTLLDFSSAAAIKRALGSDRAIRAEYSRQRSIVRKRMERMAAAGETSNRAFQRFGDIRTALPTARELSTTQMLEILQRTSQELAGGKVSTLREARKSKRNKARSFNEAAKATGMDHPLTDNQIERISRLMGMVQTVLGKKAYDSGGQQEEATALVTAPGGSKRSLLSMAAEMLSRYDADIEDMEKVKERFTSKGTLRVSWTKARKKRS